MANDLGHGVPYDVGVPTPIAPPPRSAAAPITAAILLFVTLAAALSVDVVRTGYKIKGDEATYVAGALSMAYDHDLAFERRDLERFWGLYKEGPEGIFLKRGKQIRVRLRAVPPFVWVYNDTPDAHPERLYFGKSMAYSVAAAPFVRLLGMNGFLVFHVLMLFAVCACGYLFLVERSKPGAALVFSLAFVGASVVPVYAVFITPELFNLTLVFLAYFCWLYKEVTGARAHALSGEGSDIAAAILLGIATYSKPLVAPLVAPLVLLLWWRRRWYRGFVVGAVAVAAACVFFAANAAVSGEFNYQGGDRKTFYSSASASAPAAAGFPFESPQATWDTKGYREGTDDLGAQDSLKPTEIVRLLFINSEYFLLGRHFGFVPYFFPGAVIILAWLLSRARSDPWRLSTFAGVVLSTLALLVIFPYTWSGGGGPPGDRYFMSVYPAIFFLMPPVQSVAPGLLAWMGGALFTAKILLNPFVAAKNTWEITQHGFARRLPVELTMANDLPVMLDTTIRGRVLYSHDPFVLLYFLDQHAYPPEPDGMWIAGDGRADIIVRSVHPLDHLRITAHSSIRSTFTVSVGGRAASVPVVPGTFATFDVPTSGVKGFRSYAYLLSAQSSDGFVPRLLDASQPDDRNLGVQMTFVAVERPQSEW